MCLTQREKSFKTSKTYIHLYICVFKWINLVIIGSIIQKTKLIKQMKFIWWKVIVLTYSESRLMSSLVNVISSLIGSQFMISFIIDCYIKMSDIVITWLIISLLVWHQVITLSGHYYSNLDFLETDFNQSCMTLMFKLSIGVRKLKSLILLECG